MLRVQSALRRCVSQSKRLFSSTVDTPYPGVPNTTFMNVLEDVVYTDYPVAPTYRITDLEGRFIDPEYKIPMDNETLVRAYKHMVELQFIDEIFYNAQRQGRISFYMTNTGEEASAIGSASALEEGDVIFTQYREAGVFLWRGFSLEQITHQLFSNEHDLGKGRQMPVHYGSKKLNMHTVSSPLGTQVPQATGAAYALKLSGKPNIAACYMGDGAASEGDVHTAMNFAATTESPVLFFIRNNGFAISTHTTDQYRGDGILSRAQGYGIAACRVDGNDMLAVHEATAYARQYMLDNQRPFMIEALSYRGGHHSTSDDSSAYRSVETIQHWAQNNHPVTRLRLLLENLNLWDADQQVALADTTRREVRNLLLKGEVARKPPISQMFTDVYKEIPKHLEEQQSELLEHLKIHADKYPLNQYQDDEGYTVPTRNS